MTNSSAAATDEISWNLVPLTPEYLEEEHGGYVRAIDAALAEPKIKNIALSGNYGVGKSSILQQVAENHADKVVEISLSTLAPKVEADVDDTIPKQATTTTNRIQQEIVKQLLYREEPQKLTGSRFRRIERFYWIREIGIAGILGFVIAVIFLLAGWTDTISNTLMPRIFLGLYDHLAVLVVAALSVISFRRLFHGRLRITQLSAGAATVTLDEKSMSYFDQYLDEIVHFFDVSKRTIVIFEDIDRFDDPYIFETLRALNTLLNASRKGGKTVRFIYAIKDSIFDIDRSTTLSVEANLESESTHAEIVRANRTKFFDIVIPVVPFITHRSAKNLAHRLLKDINHRIEPELLDLASRYVPDMRLLKNARNEFIVFKDRIFSGDGKDLKLSETELFAMMLYKCTHLSDFEAIRLGKSSLDKLYDEFRKLIASSINSTNTKLVFNQKRLNKIAGKTDLSLLLKSKFLKHAARTAREVGYNLQFGQMTVDGIHVDENTLGNVEFWSSFILGAESASIKWSSNRYSNHHLTFTKSDISDATGISLEPDDWDEENYSQIRGEVKQYQNGLRFLRFADMTDVIKRGGAEVGYLETIAGFEGSVIKLLGKGLAYQLIKAGYIGRNFTLYTSTFYGDRVSPAAQNFIIHNIECNVADMYFQLSKDDVEGIIRECEAHHFQEPALYNLDILNHLLKFRPHLARSMLLSIIVMESEQRRFFQTYLNIGKRAVRFIKNLAEIFPDIFYQIIAEVEIEDLKRRKLISIALSSLNSNVKYRLGSAVKDYFAENYAFFPVLTSENVELKTIRKIADFFLNHGVHADKLTPLSSTCRKEFIRLNLYSVSRENIRLVFENQSSLALDVALELNKVVYKYLLQNLQDYLTAVDGLSETICSNTKLIQILEDVLASHPSLLEPVIANSSEDCIVDHIDKISSDVWPYLAKYNRFKPTFANINRYLEEIGKIDNNLSIVLESTDKILESASFSEEEKQSVAVKVLTAKDTLQSAQLRVSLVKSLNLDDYLDIGELPIEEGELFALLLKGNIIEDSIESYTHIASTEWPTREAFIKQSENFKDFITTDLADCNIINILTSNKVSVSVKNAILDRVTEFEYVCTKEDLRQIGLTALQLGRTIPISLVVKMPTYKVSNRDVLALLFPHLSVVTKEQLLEVLENMGGDYSRLTSVGYGVIKVAESKEIIAVLDLLKQYAIVSKVVPHSGFLHVYRKHKEQI